MFLNCHSFQSLRYGTISVIGLVEQAKALGLKSLALTDINTITGIYEFVKECIANSIKPLVGMELREDNKLHFVGLAKDRRGIAELCQFITHSNLNKESLPKHAPAFEHTFVIYPLNNVPPILRENEYIGVRPQEIIKLHRAEWKKHKSKMLILQPVTLNKGAKIYKLHRVLRAIDRNTILSKVEQSDLCAASEYMIPENELISSYLDYPEIIDNTKFIVEQCNYTFDFSTSKNKLIFTDSIENDLKLLSKLAYKGLERRYPKDQQRAKAQVEKELKVIADLGFCGYILFTWDYVRESDELGFYHVGRGSGANSIVSYCLGITEVCPIELDLFFERFLNPTRSSPPDFDIDWSWKDRDTILNYIFKKHGAQHVAFTGTIVEFKFRSQIRELGKVYGLPKAELDELSRNRNQVARDTITAEIFEFAELLDKYPNARSMHSCGILISEEPLTNYTGLELPPKGFPVVQFDMHVAEDIGFEKFDVLSQRGLGTIRDCVELIEKNRGEVIDIRNIPLSKNNERCNMWLQRGKTLGCFYIESPAMRGLLRRLKCDNYITLVAASSIIRPGVAMSGAMKEYIYRHNNRDKFEYLHPIFEQHLKETYGIMVYQEDVIKILHHFAGLTLAEADTMRRMMSGKSVKKDAFEALKMKFFANCTQRGYSDALSVEVFRQIQSFAGYSFCKAHSASYAIESYQSLYLKVHYPIEFMVAAINNFGGFYRTEVYIHEARMEGATILPPCVNESNLLTTLKGVCVYLGLGLLQAMETEVAEAITISREKYGKYKSLEDFIDRVPLGLELLQKLIYVGAFTFTGKTKAELILAANMQFNKTARISQLSRLFYEAPKEFKLPQLERSVFEDAFDELQYLGFPVSCSPFDLLKTEYRGDTFVEDLLTKHKKVVRMVAYLISTKHVPTKRGDMYFGTWIDAKGEYFDTAHFSDSLKNYPFQGGGCYLLQGKVGIDYHFPTITIDKMGKLPFVPDPRYPTGDKKQFDLQNQMKEDRSVTHREPYPSESGLPRTSIN